MNFRIMMIVSMLSLTLHATTVLYQNFDNLVDQSDHVIGGTVSKLDAKKYKSGEIYTVVSLTDAFIVTENGKTIAKKPMKIRYKGGEIDLYGKDGKKIGVQGVHAVGTPELIIGKKVILFISNNGIADMPIYGWEQGLFYIDKLDGVNGVNGKKHKPILGIDGSHFVYKTSKEPSSNKQVSIIGTDANAKVVTVAKIISSDGGKDTIITNAQANDSLIAKLSYDSTMDVSNFVSMIQERKAIKRSRTRKPEKNTSDLFTLPEVNSSQVSVSMDNNKVANQTMSNDPIDEQPIEPLSKPTKTNNEHIN